MTRRVAHGCGAGHLPVALLGALWCLAGLPTGIAIGIHAADAAIPTWRVDEVLTPLHAVRAQAVGGAPESQRRPLDFSSTPAQDRGRCPLVKLAEAFHMRARDTSGFGQSGLWETPSNVELLSWSQSFFPPNWKTMYMHNLDQRPVLKVSESSEEDLKFMFDWQAGAPPADYPAIANYDNAMVASLYKERYDDVLSRNESLDGGSTQRRTAAAIMDCDGRLLYVVRLLQPHRDGLPGGIDIYDRNGRLATHALTDPVVPRYQFIDPRGYLLATAEAPGINLNVSKRDLATDPARGNILPYAIKFESGGYANASALLDIDHRWVIAAAVQLRAVHDGQEGWTPRAREFVVAMYWVAAAAGALLVGLVVYLVYILVYPQRRPGWSPSQADKRAALPAHGFY